MTLSEFKRLQESKNWKQFIYLSENQPDYDTRVPLVVNLAFRSMSIFATPPTTAFVFAGRGNIMGLNHIVGIACEPDILGDVLIFSNWNGEKYIVIAQDQEYDGWRRGM